MILVLEMRSTYKQGWYRCAEQCRKGKNVATCVVFLEDFLLTYPNISIQSQKTLDSLPVIILSDTSIRRSCTFRNIVGAKSIYHLSGACYSRVDISTMLIYSFSDLSLVHLPVNTLRRRQLP